MSFADDAGERGWDMSNEITGMPPGRRQIISCVSAALLLLTACDEPAPDETSEATQDEIAAPADDDVIEGATVEETPPSQPGAASWRFESDGAVHEGRLARYLVLDGDTMIQFFNVDAVNLALAFDGEMQGVQTVTTAMFAEGRGPICERVGEEDSFQITFELSDNDWLAGSFAGYLGCPDFSLMEVSGTFTVPRPREEQ